MKILQINMVYGQGSTGKIAADIERHLAASGVESAVCYGRKSADSGYKFCHEYEAAFNKAINMAGGLRYADHTPATRRLIRHIKSYGPDAVHIHCINSYCVSIYTLMRYLAENKIPTLVTHHAEFYYTGSCSYALDCMQFTNEGGCESCPRPKAATGALWRDNSRRGWARMKEAFQRFDHDKLMFTAVSPWVRERAALSPIVAGYECRVVENGINTDIFKVTTDREWARRNLIPGCKDKVALHVTAYFSDRKNDFKGGDKILELAREMPDVTFAVAATYSEVNGELPPNVYLHGRTKDQKELADLYNAADVTLITSQKETFSMIVAESLCCGTPVAGFKAGGPESIGISPYCSFTDREKGTQELKQMIFRLMDSDFTPAIISEAAMEKFSTASMAEGYLKCYKSLIK